MLLKAILVVAAVALTDDDALVSTRAREVNSKRVSLRLSAIYPNSEPHSWRHIFMLLLLLLFFFSYYFPVVPRDWNDAFNGMREYVRHAFMCVCVYSLIRRRCISL